MEIKTKTLDKKSDGKIAIIKKEVVETYTEQDIIQRKNQLQYEKSTIKQQMQALKDRYDVVNAGIAECDEMLTQFTEELPEIK